MTRKRSKSIGNRPITEAGLLQSELARAAFEELTVKRGVDKQRLMSLLSRIPSAPDTPVPLVDQMGDRSVFALSGQIHRWADKIKIVNSSLWVGPRRLRQSVASGRNPKIYPKPLDSILSRGLGETAAQRFEDLPTILHLYDVLRRNFWTLN